MSLRQIVVKNATTMSLHERFSKIRKHKEASASGERVMQQLASNRNRRLAQQMERRPSVAAALRKESIKSRLGLPGSVSVRERLRYPRAFTARRGRGFSGKSPLTRGLSRLNAMDVDVTPIRRARSPYVVANKIKQRRSRSRSRSRIPVRSRSRSRGRSVSRTGFRPRSRSRSRSSFKGNTLSLRGQFSGRRISFRRGRGIGMRTSRSNIDLKSFRPKLTGFRGGNRHRGGRTFRGRGRGRGGGRNITGGRGRGRGRGNYQNRRIPTKEELDHELDQYMSTTKASLDKELDVMMSEDKLN